MKQCLGSKSVVVSRISELLQTSQKESVSLSPYHSITFFLPPADANVGVWLHVEEETREKDPQLSPSPPVRCEKSISP